MEKDFSFGIVPIYETEDGNYEFLLINQKTNTGSFWGFPKGHAEEGENRIESAKRELWEEVGISEAELIDHKPYQVKYSFVDKGVVINKTVKYWPAWVKTKKIEIQNTELNGYKWANFENAINILTHENSKELLKKINENFL